MTIDLGLATIIAALIATTGAIIGALITQSHASSKAKQTTPPTPVKAEVKQNEQLEQKTTQSETTDSTISTRVVLTVTAISTLFVIVTIGIAVIIDNSFEGANGITAPKYSNYVKAYLINLDSQPSNPNNASATFNITYTLDASWTYNGSSYATIQATRLTVNQNDVDILKKSSKALIRPGKGSISQFVYHPAFSVNSVTTSYTVTFSMCPANTRVGQRCLDTLVTWQQP